MPGMNKCKIKLFFSFPINGDVFQYTTEISENVGRDRRKWEQWFLETGKETERMCPDVEHCPRYVLEHSKHSPHLSKGLLGRLNIFRLRINKQGEVIGCTNPTFSPEGDLKAESVFQRVPQLPDTGIDEIYLSLEIFDSEESRQDDLETIAYAHWRHSLNGIVEPIIYRLHYPLELPPLPEEDRMRLMKLIAEVEKNSLILKAPAVELEKDSTVENPMPYRTFKKDVLLRMATLWHPQIKEHFPEVLVTLNPQGSVVGATIFRSSGNAIVDSYTLEILNGVKFHNINDWFRGQLFRFNIDFADVEKCKFGYIPPVKDAENHT